MVRKLKFHEQKLLKKVDFISWKADNNLHEVKIMRKYHVEKREDYTLYNKLSREIRLAARKISQLHTTDPFRDECSAKLLQKLYTMGLITKKTNLELADKVTASSFCRRRLPWVMMRLKMAENVISAVKFIRHGHVRVGVELVKDPAFLVTKTMEDFITWVDTSAIKKHVLDYNNERDDFDLLS